LGRISAPAIVGGLELVSSGIGTINEWLIRNELPLRKFVATISGLMAIQQELNQPKNRDGKKS